MIRTDLLMLGLPLVLTAAAFAADKREPEAPQPRPTWPGCISIFTNGSRLGNDKAKNDRLLTAVKEAGFGAIAETPPHLNQVTRHGLKLLIVAWPHESLAMAKAGTYKDEDAVLGYYLSDRTQPSKFAMLAEWEKKMRAGDPAHPAFFTTKAIWNPLPQFTDTVKPRAIEFYHYHWAPKRHPERFYLYLEQYRTAAIKMGHVPLVRYVHVHGDDVRKMRQTVMSSLAYGVRGFKWWVGWTCFDLKKVDKRGVAVRSKIGDEVARLNAAINAYAPVFRKARSVAVWHTKPLPLGGKAAPEGYWARAEGEHIAMGIFQDADRDTYLLVANRDAFNKREAVVRFTTKPTAVRRMDKATGNWRDVSPAEGGSLELTLPGGDGELFHVARTPQRTPKRD
jgi:hypothetical protein